ncbi:MAG TPA: pilus assembly protein [Xanthobacteraceae bacterium]|nr:pilus assembly protein [Xanthobacteraceae bacterium]
MSRVWCCVERFLRDRRGNIAPMFGIALVPIVAFVGAAVDFSRASSVRTEMQDALDATALMLSKESAGQTDEQLTSKATAYFNALFKNSEAVGVTVTASHTTEGGSTLIVNGSGKMPTSFTKLLGIPELPFNSSSTVKWGSTKLRVALALDNTGSMASAGKMPALKSATKNLLTILQNAATTPGDVQVSIVPFAKDVNMGNGYYNEPWLNWTEWEKKNGTCSISGKKSKDECESATTTVSTGLFCLGNYCWDGTKFVPKQTVNGVWTPANHSTWNGCITDRDQDHDVKNTTPVATDNATKFVPEQYSACPTALMPLTYDWAALNQKVDAMQPAGNTNITIGLALAWQTLSPLAPFSAPQPESDVQQIIILLTDGDNTQNRWSSSQSTIDARTKKACDNVKAAGITIYTVLVMEGNAALLQSCASKSEMYFGLTSATQLVSTFNQIGTDLAKLRIAK